MKHSLVIVAVVASLVGGSVVYSGVQPNSWFQQQPVSKKVSNIAGRANIDNVAYVSNDQATTAYNKVKNTVVTIQNLQKDHSQVNGDFSVFFGRAPQEEGKTTTEKTASEGSGAIYKVQNGEIYIITNNHVVADSDSLQIITASGDKVKATIVGTNAEKDIAVIKAKTNTIKTAAEFGKVSSLQSGQQVLAIGSPLGSDYATSVTSGIISAPRRQLNMQANGTAATVIQTDAAINPGNSGGPLINLAGQIIGINSSKIASSGDGTSVEGMGFAIPSDVVQNFIHTTEK